MGIKEEFEKAFESRTVVPVNEKGCFLEGANWAMERCTKIVCSHNGEFAPHKDCCQNVIEIRQLAKELDQ